MFPIPFPWLETTLPNLFSWVVVLTLACTLVLAVGGIAFVFTAGVQPASSRNKRDARFGFMLLLAGLVVWAFGYYLVPVMILIILLGVIIGLFQGARRALGL